MNGSLSSAGTLAGIATALADVLACEPQTATADTCGCTQPAISRRQDDLHMYPADELLRLALHRPHLAEAIVRALRGQRTQGDTGALAAALVIEIALAGAVATDVVQALADGRIDRREAAIIREHTLNRRRHEDEKMLPALTAIVQGDGQ